MLDQQEGRRPSIQFPSDYAPGYELARAVDSERTSNYLAHTLIGDGPADNLMAELAPLGQAETGRLIRIGMDGDDSALRDAPACVRDFFDPLAEPPVWVEHADFIPGIRMFHRNVQVMLAGLLGGVLVEGFSTNIAKSFFITGRLRDQGVRRLRQNNRHMAELFLPGGLGREGDGWKLTVRIRLVHAQVRLLLSKSEDWDSAAWGVPISAAHLGFAVTAFSARLLKHIGGLGASVDSNERTSFMAVWRYVGYLMGIPETILFQNEADALELFELGAMCEPPPSAESIILANSLVQSAPLVIGTIGPGQPPQIGAVHIPCFAAAHRHVLGG